MLPSRDNMATKQRFQFKLREPGWEARYMDRAEQGITHLDIIRANIKQEFEEDLFAQLNDEYKDQSSPEYQKYRKYISIVAQLFVQTFTFHYFHKQGFDVNPPIDELFDTLGCDWVRFDQFEEALSAFNTCVEISKREGCWWPQKLCARFNHLAFVHMALGNNQEQLRASMYGAAFAVVAKNSASESTTCPSSVFNLSFLNLAAQFAGFNPDFDIKNHFIEDTLQAWEKYVAERRHTLQEKLDSGKQEVTDEVDLWFALTDFLAHNNRDSFKTMLEIKTKFSLSGSLSASELGATLQRGSSSLTLCQRGRCDLATREFKLLLQACQIDIFNDVILDAKNAEKLRTNLNFVFDLLEVASILDPHSNQCEGWSISSKPMVSLYTDDCGKPCYPGVCFSLIIKQDSAPNDFVNNCELATRSAGGIATPVTAGGSNYEEFVAIQKRMAFKNWNLNDLSDFQEFANIGRDLGLWATSSSTAAAAPVRNIRIALNTVFTIATTVRKFPLHPHAAKLMLQDVVSRLTDQFNPEVKEFSMKILMVYAQICDDLSDAEEGVNCCMKALRLAEEHNMDKAKSGIHYLLGLTYLRLRNLIQAEEELEKAQGIMKNYPDLENDDDWKANIEGAQGYLELLKALSIAPRNRDLAGKHGVDAVEKLTRSLQLIEELETSKEDYSVHFNFISISMRLCDAYRFINKLPEAQTACTMALQKAKNLKLTNELKFSKKLKYQTIEAAIMCGFQAQLMGNFVSAEDFYRKGIQEAQELDEHGYGDEFMVGKLHGGLGRLLLSQDKLPEAEDVLRKAVDACSRHVMLRDLTSQTRVLTFDYLQHCYNDLQLCLYATYMQTAECERGIKAVEALIAAERGRCRDLALNLEVLNSRITDNEDVSNNHSMDELDWKKFDTDTEYAWGHLKICMEKCTDAIKEQNPEVHRVTFVEYTLTLRHMLIWVVHSHGKQESSSSQETTLPSMYAVEVKTKVEDTDLTNYLPHYEKNFSWIYGPHAWDSHRDHMLQYAHGGEAVAIFIKKIEQLRMFDKVDRKTLVELYDLLISPIADKLATGEPVIFIPHEGLSIVPFAALKRKAGRSKHFIEDHPIGYASSVRTLGWATNQYTTLKANITMSARNPLLLVADPRPLAVDKALLEDAIKEVNEIAALPQIPANSTITLTGKEATLKNVTSAMKTASWFHIGCHGEVNPEHPQGVLFLTRCSGDSSSKVKDSPNSSDSNIVNDAVHSPSSDGDPECKLHGKGGCGLTPEILTNDVRFMTAQAAVLSACKAGWGKQTGEGLLGLSRAFLQVGVPLAIAPLRTVNSRLASAFMQSFYGRLVAGESVMFAMRNTMVDVIKKKILVPDVDDEEAAVTWELWDWAAWVAVGFPGVCLPLCDSQH